MLPLTVDVVIGLEVVADVWIWSGTGRRRPQRKKGHPVIVVPLNSWELNPFNRRSIRQFPILLKS